MVLLKSTNNRRAQAWGTDLVLAVAIFSVSLIAVYFYAINDSSESEEVMNSLFYDGSKISDMILSEGYPSDWDGANVLQIGVVTGGKINQTKLEKFKTLDYQRTKILFNTQYEYYFFVDNFVSETSVGDISYENSKNLIKITRIVVYNDTIVPAYLYIFENE